MTNSALLTMLLVQVPVTIITVYFFYKMLTAKPKVPVNEDSYKENDEI